MTWIYIIGGGLALYWVINQFVLAPGRALKKKFQAAGSLRGRTKAEIIDLVGPPQATSAYQNGTSLLQWQATGYHMCLGFDEKDVCLGVQSQYVDRNISS